MGRVTSRTRAVRVEVEVDGTARRRDRVETLAVEAPMQVRVDGEPLSVTMRTPGDDFDLTIGFLLSEGVIAGAQDVRALMHCQDEDETGSPTFNVVDVSLADGVVRPDASAARRTVTSSACGVCGTASIDAVRTTGRYDVAADPVAVDPAVVAALPDALRAHQKVFDRTGAVHAAGLFTADGELLCVREDVGRHNAVDKVLGWAAREGRLPLTGHLLAVSSRAGFELVQKAYVAGVPVLAAVSAPTSLAVDLAADTGLTLIGFVRPPRLTVYAGAHRLTLRDPASEVVPEPAPDPAPEGTDASQQLVSSPGRL